MLPKEEALKNVKLFVLDMDGTIFIGGKAIPGAAEFVHDLEAAEDIDYVFFTNNASKAPSVYVDKLRGFGIDVPIEKIMTAGDVCAEYIKLHYPGAKVLLNGTPILEENWTQRGIELVWEDPDVCVQSFDTSLTYYKLDRICHYIRNGAPFLATHMDTNCPAEYGYMPDCGAMCALITESTGVKPRYFGKPWKETMEMITEMTGYPLEEIAVVGDRIYTDVATGVNNGAKGFLVLTGESDWKTVEESDVEPTCVFDSLGEMRKYLQTFFTCLW